MSRKFDNAMEATVEQQEKGRVFLSSFGEEKENDFINGDTKDKITKIFMDIKKKKTLTLWAKYLNNLII